MIFYKSKEQIEKSFRRNPLDKISSTESKNERKRIRDKLDRIQCIYLRAFRIGRGGGRHNPTTECGFRQNHLRFVARDS